NYEFQFHNRKRWADGTDFGPNAYVETIASAARNGSWYQIVSNIKHIETNSMSLRIQLRNRINCFPAFVTSPFLGPTRAGSWNNSCCIETSSGRYFLAKSHHSMYSFDANPWLGGEPSYPSLCCKVIRSPTNGIQEFLAGKCDVT